VLANITLNLPFASGNVKENHDAESVELFALSFEQTIVHFCKPHFQELMKSVEISGSYHEGDSSILVSDTHKVMSYDRTHSCCHCFCLVRTDTRFIQSTLHVFCGISIRNQIEMWQSHLGFRFSPAAANFLLYLSPEDLCQKELRS
jgi:hypothetical protein